MVKEVSKNITKLPSFEAIQADFREAKSYVKTAKKLREIGYLEEVENCFAKAIELYEDTVEQLFSFLNASQLARLSSQNVSSPLEVIRQADKDRKEAAKSIEEGKQLEELGKFDEALDCYHRASALHPNLPWVYYSVGDLLRKKGQWHEAIVFYCECIKISPETPWSYHALGDIMSQNQKLDEAIAFYEWALQLKPDLYWSHNALGGIYERLGKLEKSEYHYRQALEIDPNLEQAKVGLERALEHKR